MLTEGRAPSLEFRLNLYYPPVTKTLFVNIHVMCPRKAYLRYPFHYTDLCHHKPFMQAHTHTHTQTFPAERG